MTGRRRSYLQHWAPLHDMTVEEATANFPKEAGIARYGEPEEIAELMAFLVLPGARWITGSTLRMDGGEVEVDLDDSDGLETPCEVMAASRRSCWQRRGSSSAARPKTTARGPGTGCSIIWAMTGGGRDIRLRPAAGLRHPESAGRGDARLVDSDGEPVPRGTAGELLLRGPNVSIGYGRAGPHRPVRTRRLARHGRHHAAGRRGRALVRVPQEGPDHPRRLQAPAEVEQALKSHPGVREAAVIGVPDPRLGQRVAALIELAANADDAVLDEILAKVKAAGRRLQAARNGCRPCARSPRTPSARSTANRCPPCWRRPDPRPSDCPACHPG